METLYHISPVPCTGESHLTQGNWKGPCGGRAQEQLLGLEPTYLATGAVQAKHGQEGAEQE